MTSQDDDELERLAVSVGTVLAGAGWRLATVESCTGGWIAQVVTSVPGSSAWFERGFVTYSNQAKTELVGVAVDLLVAHGAVSAPVAVAMAAGGLAGSAVDLCVAVTGIAGPGGGMPGKPVGTVYIAWAFGAGRADVEHCRFHGDRHAVRRAAVAHALRGVLERLRLNEE